AFRGGTMLGSAKLRSAEQCEVTLTTGLHRPSCNSDRDNDRHREKSEEHDDGEPSAGNLGALRDEPVDEVGDPLVEAFGEVLFRVDRLGQLALRGVVRGVTVDEDGGHWSGMPYQPQMIGGVRRIVR